MLRRQTLIRCNLDPAQSLRRTVGLDRLCILLHHGDFLLARAHLVLDVFLLLFPLLLLSFILFPVLLVLDAHVVALRLNLKVVMRVDLLKSSNDFVSFLS